MQAAIIGYGWVGKSMQQLFPKAYVYDPIFNDRPHDTRKYDYGTDKDKVNKCDVAFICVPTPNLETGRLDISIVEEVVAWCNCSLIVIRSTVNPGDTAYLSNKYRKIIVVQPEYLGETPSHPLLNPKERPFLIIGGTDQGRRKLIEIYQSVYNANITIRQVTPTEAEVIKLSENRAIAFKVAQCQELYDACKASHVDYYTVRDAVYGDDPRFNLWFTFVYPDNRGMNSKCIPKDVYAWAAWAESNGYKPDITRALLERNKAWISQ